MGQSWLTLRFVLGISFGFSNVENQDTDFGSFFTTGCRRWLNSHHLGKAQKCLQGPAQISWLPCLTWRLRCALELEQRSIQGSVCTGHTWWLVPHPGGRASRRIPGCWNIYWSIKGRLQEQSQICVVGGRMWDIMASLLIFTFSCHVLVSFVGGTLANFRTTFCSGIFAFVDSEAQKIQSKMIPARALFIW